MKKLLLLALLVVGCIFDDQGYTREKNVLGFINLIVAEKEAYNTYWKVSGITVNESNYGNATLTPWYIEASFDTTTIGITHLGTETNTVPITIEPGDTLYWTLYHYNNNLIESDYPDFVIKNLHAYEFISVEHHIWGN